MQGIDILLGINNKDLKDHACKTLAPLQVGPFSLVVRKPNIPPSPSPGRFTSP